MPLSHEANVLAVPADGRSRPVSLLGWCNPHPINVTLAQEYINGIRNRIAQDIRELLPRCEKVDRSLTPDQQRHRGYAASKVPRKALLTLGETPTVIRRPAALQ